MSYATGAVFSYYRLKNINAMQTAQMAFQKMNQEQTTQKMQELLKMMPEIKPEHLGNNIDIKL